MDNDNKNVQPAQYDWSATASAADEDILSPVMIRRKIKRSYGWAGLAMVFQLLISFAVNFIISFIYSTKAVMDFLAQNPEATQEQIHERKNLYLPYLLSCV